MNENKRGLSYLLSFGRRETDLSAPLKCLSFKTHLRPFWNTLISQSLSLSLTHTDRERERETQTETETERRGKIKLCVCVGEMSWSMACVSCHIQLRFSWSIHPTWQFHTLQILNFIFLFIFSPWERNTRDKTIIFNENPFAMGTGLLLRGGKSGDLIAIFISMHREAPRNTRKACSSPNSKYNQVIQMQSQI